MWARTNTKTTMNLITSNSIKRGKKYNQAKRTQEEIHAKQKYWESKLSTERREISNI